jgi:hypothetical protein
MSFQEVAMTQPVNIETELQKIVSMTEIICATENHTVNWEDILSELEAYAEKGCAPSDTARFTADIVRVVRERAGHIERFLAFDTTGEAAEYLVLYALCKVGIASTGENPEPFLRAALTANRLHPSEHLRKALIESAASLITDNGEDEVPPLIDASVLLLDDTGILDTLIHETLDRIADPSWVAKTALDEAFVDIARMMEM